MTGSLLLPLLLIAATVPAPPSSADLPSLPSILQGVIARDAETQRDLQSMEYDEHVHTERLDAKGNVIQRQDLQFIVRPGASEEVQVVSTRGDNLPTDPDEAAREAQGKETQRRQQTFDLKSIATRFDLRLEGESTELGAKAYIISFEPKPNQVFHSQTEKVLNQLHGRIWIRASDDTILRTEATLVHPVQVAWIFASITRLDFHYELPPGGGEYGPSWLDTEVEVHASLVTIRQKQRVEMTHFRARNASTAASP